MTNNDDRWVEDIMTTLFDQQKITESFGNDKKEEGRREGILEGKLEARREGKIEGRREAQRYTALALLKAGKFSTEEIAQYSGMSAAEVKKLAEKNTG